MLRCPRLWVSGTSSIRPPEAQDRPIGAEPPEIRLTGQKRTQNLINMGEWIWGQGAKGALTFGLFLLL